MENTCADMKFPNASDIFTGVINVLVIEKQKHAKLPGTIIKLVLMQYISEGVSYDFNCEKWLKKRSVAELFNQSRGPWKSEGTRFRLLNLASQPLLILGELQKKTSPILLMIDQISRYAKLTRVNNAPDS